MKLLTDENFSGPVTRGLLEKKPSLDLVRAQDVGLRTIDDPTILEWAALNQRVLLTRDVQTIPDFAYTRIRKGFPTPGMVETHATLKSEAEPDRWLSEVRAKNCDHLKESPVIV